MPARSRIDRAGLVLAAGSIVNGLASLVFIRLGNQAYGAAAFAPVSIVWSVWSVTVAVLTFPMQHWAVREGRRRGSDPVVRGTATHLTRWAFLGGTVAAIVAAVLGEDVLRTGSWTSPVTIGILVAMAVPIGYLRGELVARDRYTSAAGVTAGENVVRLLAAAIAVLLGWSVDAFLFTLALGPLVMLGWPRLLRSGPRGVAPASVRDVGELSAANSLSQLSLAGGPILMALLGSPDRLISGVFNTLSLARAPYLVLLGASMRLTALWSDERRRQITRGWIAVTTVTLALMAALVGVFAGPFVVALVFGPGTALTGTATAAIAAGATLALGTLVMTSRYTTQDDTSGLARSWILATVLGAAGLAVPSSSLVRVLTWFVLTELLAIGLLGSRRVTPRRPLVH